jgi:hypothetical protein
MLSDEEINKLFEDMNLMIAVPEKWIWSNSVSLLWATSLTLLEKPKHTHIVADAHAPMSACRNRLARRFYDGGYNWMLFLDDDVIPPYDTIRQMLRFSDEYDILSGVYFRKSLRKAHKPVAFANMRKDSKGRWWWNTIVKWPQGVCPVDGFGLGCCLVPRYAIEKIIKGAGFPLFEYEFDKTHGWYMETEPEYFNIGEDLHFCKQAKDSGLKLGLVSNVMCEHTGPQSSITVRDFKKAFNEGRLLGEAYDLPIVYPDQKLVLEDLVNYFGLTPNVLMEKMSFGTQKFKYELIDNNIPIKTQGHRNKLYMDSKQKLFRDIAWNYFYYDKMMMRNKLAILSKGKVLDYGGGCGDVSLKCLESGIKDMTYYDRPSIATDFLEYRIKTRKINGLNMHYLDDGKDTLGNAKFDTIICFDFLEYCLDPVEHLRRIKAHSHPQTVLLIGMERRLSKEEHPLFMQHPDLDKLFAKAGLPPELVATLTKKKGAVILDENFKEVEYL